MVTAALLALAGPETAAPGPAPPPAGVLAAAAPGAAAGLGPGARPALPPALVARVARRAARLGAEVPDLGRWHVVPADGPADARRRAARLDARPGVAAHPAPRPAPPPAECLPPDGAEWDRSEGPTPDFGALQGHRAGLDLPDGADGAGVRITDVEYDWRPGHEELADRGLGEAREPGSLPAWWREAEHHGTAVLGLLGAAAEDGRGVTGLAAGARIVPVSPHHEGGGYDPALAIITAALDMAPGDVLLVEQQLVAGTTTGDVHSPLEWDPYYRAAIATAVGLGVVVVEPAGNGGRDLGSLGRPWLSGPGAPEHSGALMVGAAADDRRRSAFSNFGARVDVQGYGEGVITTGYGRLWNGGADRTYADCFDGTSSAAATVAAAVAVLQSESEARTGVRLTPAQVRDRLVATGLPQEGVAGDPIGPRPQVAAALADADPPAPPPAAGPPPQTPAAPAAPPPPASSPGRPAARAARAILVRRPPALMLRFAGLAPGSRVRAAGRVLRPAGGRVVLRRPPAAGRLVVRVTPPPGAGLREARFSVMLRRGGRVTVRRLT